MQRRDKANPGVGGDVRCAVYSVDKFKRAWELYDRDDRTSVEGLVEECGKGEKYERWRVGDLGVHCALCLNGARNSQRKKMEKWKIQKILRNEVRKRDLGLYIRTVPDTVTEYPPYSRSMMKIVIDMR